MSDRQRQHGDDGGGAGEATRPRPAVGKSTATARLLRRARDADGVAAGADAAVARASSSSSGAPLPAAERARFEGSLGADLSAVRVHTGAASAEAASAVSARAYTMGNDIHFAAGAYAPQDPFGLHLLAHEVAHTVQQRGGAPVTQAKLEVSTPGDAAEHEADRAADAMVIGAPARVATAPAALAREYSNIDKFVDDPAPEPPTDWGKSQDYADSETHTGADGWDARYGSNHTDGIQGIDYIRKHHGEKDAKGKGYAKMGPASQVSNGVALPTIALTDADIVAIYEGARGQPGVGDDEIQTMIARGKEYLPQMNAAFETMGIDTVQSQALFLAHQAGETQGGNAMVERDAKSRSYAPFIGRGPLQVTNKGAYVRALAYLQIRGDQIAADLAAGTKSADEIAKLTDQKQKIDECVTACKADIRNAADPKYAYLFSAANMHGAGGVESSGKVGATTVFDGKGPDEDWESGGNNQVNLDDPGTKDKPNMKSYTFEQYKALEQAHGKPTGDMQSAIDRGKVKQAVYASAYAVLNGKVQAAKAAAPPSQPSQPAAP